MIITTMKYIDEYRNKELIIKISEQLHRFKDRKYVFMEVCGGHTMAMHRFGITSLLPDNIRLISGPGCPVCVTGKSFIDKAIAYSRMSGTIIATFGDLIRVPGSISSLEKELANGADVRIVFSGLDALDIAKKNPDKRIIFLGIGFETTAPGTAAVIKEAVQLKVDNFLLLSAHKIMPPAMEVIIINGTSIQGFICPGHVSAITGSKIYNFISEKYGLGCVVTGFEPLDILQAILMLVLQIEEGRPHTAIQYKRAVTEEGNLQALKYMNDVFVLRDEYWRGFSIIKNSGLCLQDEYNSFNAEKVIPVTINKPEDDGACICGAILRGQSTPADCPLYGTTCVPASPVGACMVSGEGACQAYYKFKTHV